MQTYFGRHTADLAVDDATRAMLWNTPVVAIHYPHRLGASGIVPGEPDSESLNPEDYDRSGRQALGVLRKISLRGGYVCAEYAGQSECVVGIVPPGTPITLLRGQWRHRECPDGRVAVLKALPLQHVRRLPKSASAVILVGRPRQGTLSRWPSAGHVIEALVERRPLDRSLQSLTPAQQEVLCSEFMRLDYGERHLPRLRYLLLPPGRTMRDVDIVGVADDGRWVFGQVTHLRQESADSKLEQLRQYGEGSKAHLVLFCDCSAVNVVEGVTVYPIKRVFDLFVSSKLGAEWLDQELASMVTDSTNPAVG